METYPYIVQPTPGGNRYMPRAAYRGTRTQPEVLAAVTARLGSGPVTAEAAIRAYLQTVIECCKQGYKVEAFDDLIGFRFTCGGSFEEPTFSGTFENLDIGPSCQFGDAGLALAEEGFSGEKAGEQGRVAAEFVRVFDTAARANDHYTPDKNLEIELRNKRFKFDPANPGHWVKFRKGDGTLAAATEYYVRGSTLLARVPAALAGPVELHVSAEINGSVRETIYQYPLLP